MKQAMADAGEGEADEDSFIKSQESSKAAAGAQNPDDELNQQMVTYIAEDEAEDANDGGEGLGGCMIETTATDGSPEK